MATSSRNLIVHVRCMDIVQSYNIYTKESKEHGTLLKFADNYTKIFRQLQLMLPIDKTTEIVFCFNGFEFLTFDDFYNFRQKSFEFCQKHHIFCSFTMSVFLQASVAISQTKSMVKEGEKVMVIFVDFPGPPVGMAFIRKANHYELVSCGRPSFTPFTKNWQNEMFHNLKPKRIIFIYGDGCSKKLEKAQQYFKDYNSVAINILFVAEHNMDPFIEKALLLMDKKNYPYDIAIPCFDRLDVRFDQKSLISVTELNIAPFEKSGIINVNPKMSVSFYCTRGNNKGPELIEQIKLSIFKSKKVRVTLKIDINSFYDFKVEPINANGKVSKTHTAEMPSKGKLSKENVAGSSSDKLVEPDKAQMIFDKQNFIVSYFVDGKEYNVNDSHGKLKTPIYISFHKKKPIIGKAALEIYSEKPKFVVFDLIKLCSVATDEVFNPKWGFRLSKDSESLIVTMETFEGERKSTVEFLLAIILKEGKDRIKKETGKRIEEIEIKFDGFFPSEILKKNFIEAGKLLKINIIFV